MLISFDRMKAHNEYRGILIGLWCIFTYVFVASRGEAQINLSFALICPFINQMEQDDELNHKSSPLALVSGLRRPSQCYVSHIAKPDLWRPLVTDISWVVIGYLSDCLWEDDAVCLSDTIIKKNGGTWSAAPPGYWHAIGSGGQAEWKCWSLWD